MQHLIPVVYLHLSFILILVGAFVTWIDGEQGTLQLKLGEKTMSFINKGGEKRTLPFSISLEDFEIIYYKGHEPHGSRTVW